MTAATRFAAGALRTQRKRGERRLCGSRGDLRAFRVFQFPPERHR